MPKPTLKDLKNHPSRKQFEEMLFKYNATIANDLLEAKQERGDLRNDLKQAKQERGDLRNDLKQAKQERGDLRNDLKQEFKSEIKSLRQEVLGSMSEVMGELKNIREEIATFGYRQSQNGVQLDDHENRLTGVETHLGLATVQAL